MTTGGGGGGFQHGLHDCRFLVSSFDSMGVCAGSLVEDWLSLFRGTGREQVGCVDKAITDKHFFLGVIVAALG